MPETPPAYLRVAARIRERIGGGELPAGARLPTEDQLMREHSVSRTVIRYALNLLRGEGLIVGRQGSGNYVAQQRRLIREGHGRDQRRQPGPTSPFARDADRAGLHADWEHTSAPGQATGDVAARLGIEPGDPVMVTRYRFLADGVPIQLSTSWEPLAVTGGTDVELPEEGAAVGVVARMDHIGVRVDECLEKVTTRPARDDEVAALNLPLRGPHVLAIERTYTAAGRPVETADIVLSSRYELNYRYPVD
jgi:DNA-binding GntR family transcriptional regulator